MRAFDRLSSCRPIGLDGPGPIPWTAIDSFARRHGVPGDDFELFEMAIEGMDTEYLAFIAERRRG